MQRRGTALVGGLFGPVMAVWFVVIGLLGLRRSLRNPAILLALDPSYGIRLLIGHPLEGFVLLGAVVLAVTGAEALYADMGHFGRRPIRIDWLAFVLPALLLNYFGQGALLLAKPEALENPFYLLAPDWALYPLVVLATVATVIASQAVISGAFSMTRQAVQLGYLPRFEIRHTSEDEIGQIYVPQVNSALLVGVIAAGAGLPQLGQSRRRLRHRRHRHHVAHHHPGFRLHRGRAGLESAGRGAAVRLLPGRRPAVLLRQSAEDSSRAAGSRWRSPRSSSS